MSRIRITVLTLLAMLAFAGNSLLGRFALKHTEIDAASFTTIRLISGAIVLWLLVQIRKDSSASRGNWWSAFALVCYAVSFSFAYINLPTATGALLLFGAVQIGGQSIQTMGVSSSVSTILQALILFGAIAAGVFSRYRVEMVSGDAAEAVT